MSSPIISSETNSYLNVQLNPMLVWIMLLWRHVPVTVFGLCACCQSDHWLLTTTNLSLSDRHFPQSVKFTMLHPDCLSCCHSPWFWWKWTVLSMQTLAPYFDNTFYKDQLFLPCSCPPIVYWIADVGETTKATLVLPPGMSYSCAPTYTGV